MCRCFPPSFPQTTLPAVILIAATMEVFKSPLVFCLPWLMVEIVARRDYILTDKGGEVAFVLSSGTKTRSSGVNG